MAFGSGGNLGKSILKLATDDREFRQGVEGAKQKAIALQQSFIKVGAALTAVGAGFVAAAKKSIDLGDEMAKTSQKTGVAVETLSGLKLAAELGGTSFDSMARSLSRLARRSNDAADGTGEAKEAFDFLGLSATDAQGNLRPVEDLLFDLADRFSTMEDGTKKTSIAMDVFGRSGVDLIPVLNQGSEGMRGMIAEADTLGLVISQKAAVASENFNDSLTRLSGAFSGVVNTVLESGLLEIFTDFANRAAVVIAEFVKANPLLTQAGAIFGALAAAIGPVTIAIGLLLPALGSVAAALGTTLGVLAGGAGLVAVVGLAAVAFTEWFSGTKTGSKVLELLGEVVGLVWEVVSNLAETIFDAVVPAIKSLFGWIGDKLGPVLEKVLDQFDKNVEMLKDWGKWLGLVSDDAKDTAKETKDLGKETEDAGEKADDAKSEFEKLRDEYKKGGDEASEYQKKVKRVREEFEDLIDPGQDLADKLEILREEYDEEEIVKAYGDKIDAVVQSYKDLNKPVPDTIQHFKNVKTEIENQKQDWIDQKTGVDAAAEAIKGLNDQGVTPAAIVGLGKMGSTLKDDTNPPLGDFHTLANDAASAARDNLKPALSGLIGGESNVLHLVKEGQKKLNQKAEEGAALFRNLGGAIDDEDGVAPALGGLIGENGPLSNVTGAFGDLGTTIGDLVPALGQDISGIVGSFKKLWSSDIFSGFASLGTKFGDLVGSIADAAKNIGSSVAKIAGGIADMFSGGLASFAGGVVGGFIGGIIGGGGGKDKSIEENTRFTAIALIGPKGVIDQLWEVIRIMWLLHDLVRKQKVPGDHPLWKINKRLNQIKSQLRPMARHLAEMAELMASAGSQASAQMAGVSALRVGGAGVVNNFNIEALDGRSVERVVRKKIRPELDRQARLRR